MRPIRGLGVTSDLCKRIWQHKHDVVAGFTRKYNIHRWVWHEPHMTMESAIAREKAIKNWKRVSKLKLIEEFNPAWQELHDPLC